MMKQNVALSICGTQTYPGQESQTIELTTDGTLTNRSDCWEISYEESELTGLAGVTTTFRLEPGRVTLERVGPLRSKMVFQEGVPYESLYEMDFGALLMTVCAKHIEASISRNGGTVDLLYSISIENSDAGIVEYHLDIQPK